MMLPNRQQVQVDRSKLVDYLLNPGHPDNGGKAEFFHRWGFDAANWAQLADALAAMAASEPVECVLPSEWGMKYVMEGRLASPKGLTPLVRTVWIIDDASPRPRLVTAFPARR